MTYNYEEIGERIKNERKIAGFRSQGALAEALGFSAEYRQLIAAWESGADVPSLANALKLCELFNCELGYLLCEPNYRCKTGRTTDVQEETGLSSTAVEVLCSLKERASSSVVVVNMLETLNLLLENSDERKAEFEIVPLLEYISAYLHCAPEDKRIVSVEIDGSIKIFNDRNAYESEAGEVISGDYMRQIVRTRIERRVIDELHNLWNKKNGESRKDLFQQIMEENNQ